MVSGANGEFIGGPVASEGNVIAGNTLNGVYIHGSSSALIEGNYIGTDGNSTPELGNKQNGILLDGGASSNKIGINGTSPLAAQENVISGNLGDGVCIVGDGTTQNCVSGNYIGTDENGLHRSAQRRRRRVHNGRRLNEYDRRHLANGRQRHRQ